VFAAIEPKFSVADGGIHEGAVMGPFRMRMGSRLKMATGDAHALEWDCTGDLQLSNERNLSEQQLLLGGRREFRQSARDLRTCPCELCTQSEAIGRCSHQYSPRIFGIGVAPYESFASEGTECVCNACRGDNEVRSNLLWSHTRSPTG
jgi:hypothetical protein